MNVRMSEMRTKVNECVDVHQMTKVEQVMLKDKIAMGFIREIECAILYVIDSGGA